MKWLKKKMSEVPEEKLKGIIIDEVKPEYKVIDKYEVFAPHSRVKILSSPELGEGIFYFVEESPLNEAEQEAYDKIVNILSKEFTTPKGENIDSRSTSTSRPRASPRNITGVLASSQLTSGIRSSTTSLGT